MKIIDYIKNLYLKYSEHKKQKELKKLKMSKEQRFFDFIKNLVYAALVVILLIQPFFLEAYRIPTGSMEDTILVGDFLLGVKFLYGATSPRYIPFTDVALPYFKLPALKKVQKGDIVVFEYPGDRDELKPAVRYNYVKRCIGLPGDTILIIDKELYVNNKLYPKPKYMKFINPNIAPKGLMNPRIFPKGSNFNEDNWGPYVVPKKGDVIDLNLKNIEYWRTIIDREFGERVVKIENGKILIEDKEVNNYTIKKDYYFMMGDNRDDSADSRFWGFVPDDLVLGEVFIIYNSWDPDIPMFSIFDKLGSIRINRIAKLVH